MDVNEHEILSTDILKTLVVIDTGCIDSGKANYHTITTTAASTAV